VDDGWSLPSSVSIRTFILVRCHPSVTVSVNCCIKPICVSRVLLPSCFTDPELGFSASYYRVTEGTGSVNVVVTATMPGLSGYVTLQTENGNATGEPPVKIL